ncbi:MAG: hypothetical protein JNJ60_14680 [Rhodocyclaceae bacterium]|nr:hypothetical protein [Rhodocyclaceae bacterium]
MPQAAVVRAARRGPAAAAALLAAALCGAAQTARGADDMQWVRHIVVIYMENHSFDNLYGTWEAAPGERIDGLAAAGAAQTRQIGQNGRPYDCLLQVEPQLASPQQLAATCQDHSTATAFSSAFANAPFELGKYITAEGRTRDLVHGFYQVQYQMNGGAMNRFVTGSNAAGLAMGYYDTRALPVYAYLRSPGAPHHVVLDAMFQAAFGGSFLNHQWLVSARTPVFAGAANDGGPYDLHSVADANGMVANYPLYRSPLGDKVIDAPLSASCAPAPGRPPTPAGVLCGDYAINTLQPWHPPYAPGTPDAKRLPPLDTPEIGSALTRAGMDWAWYGGGWSNASGAVGAPGWTNGTAAAPATAANPAPCPHADANPAARWPQCPDKLFQFHHQPFVFYTAYAPGSPARAAHLRDEVEFFEAARSGRLKAVSFVKPIGANNEHPGYASVAAGSRHLRSLLEAIDAGPARAHTLVIVTYDEFGGAWDHVPPPGQGGRAGPHDRHGPGPRIPALLVSRGFARSGVDHGTYDTTSILATIARRYGLAPVGAAYAAGQPPRDAAVADLWRALTKFR